MLRQFVRHSFSKLLPRTPSRAVLFASSRVTQPVFAPVVSDAIRFVSTRTRRKPVAVVEEAKPWTDADSSTIGGALTNLQHKYSKEKYAPKNKLLGVLHKVESKEHLKLAVSALAVYQNKERFAH